MYRGIGIWLCLACFYFSQVTTQTGQAQIFTETFGNDANQFSIPFVTVGNPGNVADPNGFPYWKGKNPGSVNYEYAIGKYEITRGDIEKANGLGNTGISLYELTYATWGGLKKPATGISWNEAARFVNFLNTSQGYMPAYKFTESGANTNISLWSLGDPGYNPNNPFRNQLSKYVIPDVDEWHKAAFFNPANNSYSIYADGTTNLPNAIVGGLQGVVYNQPNDLNHGPADVDDAGSLSVYGTMAQTGNALEWLETSYDLYNDSPLDKRIFRGGSWVDNDQFIWPFTNTGGGSLDPDIEYFHVGFRVASVPEPSRRVLIVLGLLLQAIMARSGNTRKKQ